MNLEVVAVIIQWKGKILVGKKKGHLSNGGFWEFPGGKIKEGESIEQAGIREIKEELDIHISPTEVITEYSFQKEGKTIRLNALLAKYVSGKFSLVDHDKCLWVNENKIHTLGLTPENKTLFSKVMASGKGVFN